MTVKTRTSAVTRFVEIEASHLPVPSERHKNLVVYLRSLPHGRGEYDLLSDEGVRR